MTTTTEWVEQDDWSTVKKDDLVRFTLDDNMLNVKVTNVYRDNIEGYLNHMWVDIYKDRGWQLEVVKPPLPELVVGATYIDPETDVIYVPQLGGKVRYTAAQGGWVENRELRPGVRERLLKVDVEKLRA